MNNWHSYSCILWPFHKEALWFSWGKISHTCVCARCGVHVCVCVSGHSKGWQWLCYILLTRKTVNKLVHVLRMYIVLMYWCIHFWLFATVLSVRPYTYRVLLQGDRGVFDHLDLVWAIKLTIVHVHLSNYMYNVHCIICVCNPLKFWYLAFASSLEQNSD